MSAVPQPDLRPLQQPRSRAELREGRRWLREHRQPVDVPAVGLAIAGWVLLLPGALIVLVALSSPGDPAMPVVGAVMAGVGVALLVWRRARRREALRRTARMLRFAEANGLGYAQRALLGPKPAAALRQGFDFVARDVLRAPDGAEWGVWRFRLREDRGGKEMLRGYVEVPWSGASPPTGLVEDLRFAPFPLELEIAGGRLTVTALSGWRVDDPAIQSLVHRIRAIAAQQQVGLPSHGVPAPIVSTDAGRRQRAAAIASGAVVTIVALAGSLLQALIRNGV